MYHRLQNDKVFVPIKYALFFHCFIDNFSCVIILYGYPEIPPFFPPIMEKKGNILTCGYKNNTGR